MHSRDERRSRDLNHHESRVEAGVGRQKTGQTGERRVDHPRQPAFGDRSDIGERCRQIVEDRSDRRAVEVATRDQSALGKDHGIVGGRVELDLEHPMGVLEGVAAGAVDLR